MKSIQDWMDWCAVSPCEAGASFLEHLQKVRLRGGKKVPQNTLNQLEGILSGDEECFAKGTSTQVEALQQFIMNQYLAKSGLRVIKTGRKW